MWQKWKKLLKLEGKWEHQVVPHHNLEPMDGFDGISHNRLFNILNFYTVRNDWQLKMIDVKLTNNCNSRVAFITQNIHFKMMKTFSPIKIVWLVTANDCDKIEK